MTHHWLEDTVNVWYRLQCLKDGFEVVVHKTACKEIDHHLRPESPLVKAQQERFPYLQPFLSCVKGRDTGEGSSIEEKPCGFGGTLTRIEDPLSDWVTYRGMLPLVRRQSDLNADMLEQCASLRILLSSVSSFEGLTTCPSNQLMVVRKIFAGADEAEGGTLRVILTPTATKWIAGSWHVGAMMAIEKAMYLALNYMRDRSTDRALYEVGRLEPKGLSMTLPGGAMLTVADDSPDGPSTGCVLVSESMHSYEQLAFFIGLCRLHELMRPRTTREFPAIAT